MRAPQRSPVELTSTPFFPQRENQCGPAALATVLASSGVEVTADMLTDKVYIPGRRGSLQLELVAATRAYDRLAYRIDPDLETLMAEVAAGRPVLVLQNLALKHFPVWHYAAVIGYDAGRSTLILRSGTTRRQEVSARKFLRSWSQGQFWGIVILRPDELPARPRVSRYLEAAAGLEAAGHYPAALQAYRTALTRWPDDETALLGIGNVCYRQQELTAAAQAYRALLAKHPRQAVARNNLAQVLLEQGDPQAALQEICLARANLDDARFEPALQETEAQIRRALR